MPRKYQQDRIRRRRHSEPVRPIQSAPELHGEPYITDDGRTKVYFHPWQNREERIRNFEMKRGRVIIGTLDRS